jgi:hypothetical protein
VINTVFYKEGGEVKNYLSILRSNKMLGRSYNESVQPVSERQLSSDDKYKRDIFEDMIIAMSLLRELDVKLSKLHPDIVYKIRQII